MTALSRIIERSKVEREGWRYTDLEKLLAQAPPLSAPSVPVKSDVAGASARILFRDGVLQKEGSHFGDVPSDILQGSVEEGYRLALAGQTCLVAQPVELVFQNSGTAEETPVCLAIDVGANGRLTLLERHEGAARAVIAQVDVTLGRQAKFVHGRMITQSGAYIGRTRVTLAEGAYYDNFALLVGHALMRNEMDVVAEGREAQVALNGVMLLSGQDHADTKLCVTHAAPYGSSSQFYKVVADGKAQGVFQGKVIVAKGAQKTDSQQLCRSLLLSDQAEIDAKPELEIYADDVKCSHGSSIGNLDVEALFYLRARGVPEADARALLMRAFVSETLDQVQVLDWRALFKMEIDRWFHERR